jgi:hypothetical protein
MNKETSEIIGTIESYLRELHNSTPEVIGLQITKLLKEHPISSTYF